MGSVSDEIDLLEEFVFFYLTVLHKVPDIDWDIHTYVRTATDDDKQHFYL